MAFSLFLSFPPDIRWHVWLAALDFDTPRAYAFYVDLEFDYRSPKEPPHYTHPTTTQLVPGRSNAADAYRLDASWEKRWPDLTLSTQPIRALLATCHESRAAALHHSPDKLPFSTVTLRGFQRPKGYVSPDLLSDDNDDSDESPTEKPPLPERPAESTRYWLPFSGERDIIVLGISNVQCERMFANWVARGGAPLLEAVRNLALHAGDSSRGRYDLRFESGYGWPAQVVRPWKPPRPPCRCGQPECQLYSEDPLLELLAASCLRLKTLSFAVLDRRGEPMGASVGHVPFEFGLVPPCACSSGRAHAWPMVRLTNRLLEWCVWYPEAQTSCPFPTLPSLEEIRKRWHPNWPYYETLRDVEVRILRCVEVETGKDELVSGWRQREIISQTRGRGSN